MEAYLASVSKVYLQSDKPLNKDTDFVKKYNEEDLSFHSGNISR